MNNKFWRSVMVANQAYKRVLNNTKVKQVGDKRYNLLPLSCFGYYDDFSEIVNYYFLKHCNFYIHSQLSNALFALLGNRYPNSKTGRFFQIFYNQIFQTNQAVWKFEDKEFFSFRDYFIYFLLAKYCIKNKQDNLLKEINYKSISKEKSKISQIIDDKQLVEFINKLLSNEILQGLHFYIYGNPSYTTEGYNKSLKGFIQKIKESFKLFREDRQVILPYIKGTDLESYFPDTSNCNDEELFKPFGIFEIACRDLLSLAIFRIKINQFIHTDLKNNQKIDCFAERNNIFYKATIKDREQDAIVNPLYSYVRLDCKSSEEIEFAHGSWAVKDIKEKLYFPNCSDEEVVSKGKELLNSYLKRNVEIHNHNTNKEESIDNVKLYLCRESLEENCNNSIKNSISSIQEEKINPVGRQSQDYSKVFKNIHQVLFNNISDFNKQGSKSKQDYIREESSNIANLFNKLDKLKRSNIKKLIREKNGKLLGSRVQVKLNIKIDSKKNGGDINNTEIGNIIKKINQFIK